MISESKTFSVLIELSQNLINVVEHNVTFGLLHNLFIYVAFF